MTTTTANLPADAFDYLANLVLRRSAIVLERSKEYLVESRLMPVARRHGFAGLGDLVTHLRSRPAVELERQIIEAMTTNESSFFRDVHPFEALRTGVLPDVLARRATTRKLNIWSAACSSGQELYSIAMILDEHFPAIRNWNVQLLGTDLSNEMVERARQGKFNQVEVNRGLPAAGLMKHFRRDGLQWQISESLRKTARFEQMNLSGPFPSWLPRMDVIFLRNVLIYFSPETKKAVLRQVRNVLSEDGYLFLGGAETTLNLDDSFERVQFGPGVCYRLRKTSK